MVLLTTLACLVSEKHLLRSREDRPLTELLQLSSPAGFLQTESKCALALLPLASFFCLLMSTSTSSLKQLSSFLQSSNSCFITSRGEKKKNLFTLIHAANICQGLLHTLRTEGLKRDGHGQSI